MFLLPIWKVVQAIFFCLWTLNKSILEWGVPKTLECIRMKKQSLSCLLKPQDFFILELHLFINCYNSGLCACWERWHPVLPSLSPPTHQTFPSSCSAMESLVSLVTKSSVSSVTVSFVSSAMESLVYDQLWSHWWIQV